MENITAYISNMQPADWIGFAGVSMMLVAFFINIFDWLHNDHPLYICLNLVGGSLACYASVLNSYMPFVIMEGTWAVASFWALVIYFRRDFRRK